MIMRCASKSLGRRELELSSVTHRMLAYVVKDITPFHNIGSSADVGSYWRAPTHHVHALTIITSQYASANRRHNVTGGYTGGPISWRLESRAEIVASDWPIRGTCAAQSPCRHAASGQARQASMKPAGTVVSSPAIVRTACSYKTRSCTHGAGRKLDEAWLSRTSTSRCISGLLHTLLLCSRLRHSLRQLLQRSRRRRTLARRPRMSTLRLAVCSSPTASIDGP